MGRAKEAAEEKAKAEAEAAEKAREVEQKPKEQKEARDFFTFDLSGGEIKHGKESKGNDVGDDLDEVRAKEEAKAKARHGFFNGIRPDLSKSAIAFGRHENVNKEAELRAR